MPAAARTLALLALAAALAGGCRRSREAPPAPPPPTVTVARPVWHSVQSYYEYNGWTESVESVEIKARVAGFLNDIHFKEGDEVNPGDPLFTIDPRQYVAAEKKADADRLKATAEVKRTRSKEERGKALLRKNDISLEDFQQLVADRETAEAVLKQTEALLEAARLEKSYTDIRAPIEGKISRALKTRGNLVGQGEQTLLTTIVSVKQMFVFFDIPERDYIEYLRLRASATTEEVPSPTSGRLAIEAGVATEEGYPHDGFIDFSENRADPGTGTMRIRGRLPNPAVPPHHVRLLQPGLYARVRVPNGDPKPMLVIPEEALMAGQEGRYVYVLDDANVVQKRTVTVGPEVWSAPPPDSGRAPEWTLTDPDPPPATGKGPPPETEQKVRTVVAIVKGLKEGDRVIVNGLQRARPGAPVTPDEWSFKGPPPAKK